jgi:kynureninase
MSLSSQQDSLKAAEQLDHEDILRAFRGEFVFPKNKSGEEQLYFAGHSLGLMPKKARQYIEEELSAWGQLAVEGHVHARHPWLPYHENVTASFARLVGAKDCEVVAMNTLTVNLHLLMVSFYRPTAKRFKILIENNCFPSDKYAVDSQARFHGFDPREAVVELKTRPGHLTVDPEEIEEQIRALGDSLALVLLGNCNYLSGQCFPFEPVVRVGHHVGAEVGFNLAHGAGNLKLDLHAWGVDFAVWCSYKYLNAGPGGIAGAFIHENHLAKKQLPRFEGWWGHDKATRFQMGPEFSPVNTAEAWQLSNPPIFQLASLRASMELFDRATMPELRKKGDRLTSYLEWLIRRKCRQTLDVVTPPAGSRGSMLCVRLKSNPGEPRENAKPMLATLNKKNVVLDFREPDILRVTPIPLYNSFTDVYQLSEAFKEALQ